MVQSISDFSSAFCNTFVNWRERRLAMVQFNAARTTGKSFRRLAWEKISWRVPACSTLWRISRCIRRDWDKFSVGNFISVNDSTYSLLDLITHFDTFSLNLDSGLFRLRLTLEFCMPIVTSALCVWSDQSLRLRAFFGQYLKFLGFLDSCDYLLTTFYALRDRGRLRPIRMIRASFISFFRFLFFFFFFFFFIPSGPISEFGRCRHCIGLRNHRGTGTSCDIVYAD